MALLFDASSEDVDHGAGPQIDGNSPFTVGIWLNPSTVSASNRQVGGNTCSLSTNARLMTSASSGTGVMRILVPVAGGSTLREATSVTSTISASAWQFVVFKHDSGDTPMCRMYHGDLTTVVTEVSYSSNDNNSGTPRAADGNLIIGADPGNGIPFEGDIACVMVWPTTALTLAQIRQIQFLFYPQFSGCELFSHYGWNGTSGCVDWSGNGNNGTITGATVSDHVPILPAFYGGRSGLHEFRTLRRVMTT